MAIIKCKMCGGDLNIVEGATVCECEYCGTRQTVPSADNEKKLTLFNRAGRLLRACEFDKAAGVFEAIVADYPEEAEAYWGLVLCKYGIEYVDDPATGKKVPTCHRSSFDNVMKDANFEQACENTDAVARRVYRDEARAIEDLRRSILNVSDKEEPYDVFISYKEKDENGERTRDSVIAQDIYRELTREGYRVFFSRISLEDKLGTEYEPYIFAALNSAKVMIVVGTDYENFDAVWVKNEWSRYLKLIEAGQKKTLIPVFRNMDAYDMPEEFNRLAALDMGKVGAMQDLVRGVEKIVGRKNAESAQVQQPVYVSNEADAKTAAAVKRGNLALEDGEYDKATEFFNQALTLNAECAEAYLGLALAEAQCANENKYISRKCNVRPEKEKKSLFPNRDRVNTAVQNNMLPFFLRENEIRDLFRFDLVYYSDVKGMEKNAEQEKSAFQNNRNLSRAFRFAKGECRSRLEQFRANLFTKLDELVEQAKIQEKSDKDEKAKEYEEHLAAAEQKAAELHREAEEKRDAVYQSACKEQEEAKSIAEYQDAIGAFMQVEGYQDSDERIAQCRAAIEEIKEQERLRKEAEEKAAAEEAERKRKAAEEEAERQRILAERAEKERKAKQKKTGILAGIVAVAAIAAVLIVIKVIIPKQKLNNAMSLLDSGDYETAYALLEETGNNETIISSKYSRAAALLEAGDYETAYSIYEELGDNEAIASSKYNRAIEFMNAGDYENAITLLDGLSYNDSEDQLAAAKAAKQEEKNAADYEKAVELLNAGDFDKAYTLFCDLGIYRDSKEKAKEALEGKQNADYESAASLLAAGKYKEAQVAFEALGAYKDSAEQALSAKSLHYQKLLADATVGETVFLGSYEQDNNTANGKEDIEWLVLAKENNRLLVISRYVLDCLQYNTEKTDTTWNTCSLRKWLNGDFLDEAFTLDEQAKIPTVTVSAEKNPYCLFDTKPGSPTRDKIFLLSTVEVNHYSTNGSGFRSSLRCTPTEYAKAQGHLSENENCWWWLRSPGSEGYFAAVVSPDGDYRGNGNSVTKNNHGVRPALWIELG